METATNAQYHVYLVLTRADSPGIWEWPIWEKVASHLSLLFGASPEKPHISIHQTTGKNASAVKHGKLSWGSKSFEVWAHHSPTTKENSSPWAFHSLNVSVPSIAVSVKKQKYPDFYFSVMNESWPGSSAKQFNQTMILAGSCRMGTDIQRQTENTIRAIARVLGASFVGYQLRAWGKDVKSIGLNLPGAHTDSLQDLTVTGIFKVGKRQDRPIDANTFTENWISIGQNNA
jgi:hypothetical protein